MRFTFYSAVSFAALLAHKTANAVEIETNTETATETWLEETPVSEEDAEFAEAAAEAQEALSDSEMEEVDLAEINAEIEEAEELAA